MDILIYHGDDCNDGFCCALIAREIWPDIELLPGRYGDPPPPSVKGRNVLIADFSYPRPILEQLKSDTTDLVVIDHHKTAQANCDGLDYCVFDMTECGSSLLNKWLDNHENPHYHGSFHNFVRYIRDRDLWERQLEKNDIFHAWISAFPKTTNDWRWAIEKFAAGDWVEEGEILMMAQRREMDRMLCHVYRENVGGYDVPIVNNTRRDLTSDILHTMCQNESFAAAWWREKDRIVWSLRSSENGLDVSVIAKNLGGGGHKHAAGFQISVQ